MLLLVGSLYSRNFLSPEYLLQQLKVASFLGVIATGMMLVILLGQIDLSVPWVVTAGAMMACAVASFGTAGVALSVPFGILCGIAARPPERRRRRLSPHPLDDHHARHQRRRAGPDGGLFRRLLAAGFRLAADALPRDRLRRSPAFRTRSSMWAIIGAVTVFLLTRTTFGRAVYGIGNRERAAYLSGINTRRVVMIGLRDLRRAWRRSAACSSPAMPRKAAQAMGDAYLLPSIAAVVLGGTNILGGRGTYLGTVAGVILITLLQSILSVMQMPECGPAGDLRRRHHRDAAALRPRALSR